MIDKFVPAQAMTLESITLEDDEESSDHLAYKITIVTNRGNITITGNHDSFPSLNCFRGLLDHDET